ncbi:NAD(H) kinase 3 isoform X2 [Wolffia australiana]
MQSLSRWRVLVVVKPYDVYPSKGVPGLDGKSVNFSPSLESSRVVSPRVLEYIDDRRRVHKEAIKLCQDALEKRPLQWQAILRSDLSQPIRDVDIVITVGGDGTLLRTSHFLNGDIPVLGFNSDPTQRKEVEDHNYEFDARRSTGYLCAATEESFEEVLDEVLEGQRAPSNLSRISLSLNDRLMPTFALNDVLIAHPCPASVSRFSFRIESLEQKGSSLVKCRSSGLRVCTAAGSTAAMASAGGFPMPISSGELQFMSSMVTSLRFQQTPQPSKCICHRIQGLD